MGEMIIVCKKCCLLCSNSFSEPCEDEDNGDDILHCSEKDWEIVNEMDCCDKWQYVTN